MLPVVGFGIFVVFQVSSLDCVVVDLFLISFFEICMSSVSQVSSSTSC